MTIRRRLFISNILMIAVPVIATALVGLVCAAVIWKGVIGGEENVIFFLGSGHGSDAYFNLKVALIISCAAILLTVLVSVLITNRFLIKFVFRHIEEPLDILAGGVHEIRDGNLDCRITYEQADEFKPICDDFNEMALQLEESESMLRRQEKSRKELLAGISHDIRSPLTSIRAYVEGLTDGIASTPEEQKRYLDTISTKAQELDHLVSQLFMFSKMELGEYATNDILLRLDEKIEAVVSENKEHYKAQGMSIETKLIPVVVKADPIQLERVIVNIMENSLKYKTAETGLLRISIDKNAGGCILSFDDDGPGVEEEALPHLFEVFYRSDPSRHNPKDGSGLGLAIVEQIISRAGGNVTAKKSTLGGLGIEICLPCQKEETANAENTDH